IRIDHTLTNDGLWPVELASWALTVLRAGGLGVVPLLPKGEHPRDLLPAGAVVPWTYTDFSLPVWGWRPGFITIDTTKATEPQKLGLTAYPGWSAYWLDGVVFVKASFPQAAKKYPDFGCCFETFSNPDILELESLGPLTLLEPGASSGHTEYWTIFEGVEKPEDQLRYEGALLPLVNHWLTGLH
ncbi:MAG: hypothetical protein EA425_17710, partial [Puniceicoccaceae bacterium]